MLILGIESSCDETGIALYDSEQGLLAHQLYSQIAVHAEYGGVVPELASRDHIRKALPLIRESLKESGKQMSDIEGIAYTRGPGASFHCSCGGSEGARYLGLDFRNIEKEDTSTMGRNDQLFFYRVNKEVMDRDGRQSGAKGVPFFTAVQTHVNSEVIADIDDFGMSWIFVDDIDSCLRKAI